MARQASQVRHSVASLLPYMITLRSLSGVIHRRILAKILPTSLKVKDYVFKTTLNEGNNFIIV